MRLSITCTTFASNESSPLSHSWFVNICVKKQDGICNSPCSKSEQLDGGTRSSSCQGLNPSPQTDQMPQLSAGVVSTRSKSTISRGLNTTLSLKGFDHIVTKKIVTSSLLKVLKVQCGRHVFKHVFKYSEM